VSRRLGVFVLVAAAATFATVLVRTLAGEALGSDAYSHLVWARDAVRHGVTGHAPFDYTVPKPFEQAVALIGTKLGAATFVFEWTSLLGVLGCAVAAAALAHRLGRYPAAPLAALFALCLPVLWRGGPLGDSNVPYAALVVGAAAAGMCTPACSGMLALAGTLRPEAWGLAVINAVLGWRRATATARALSVLAALVPPVLWATLDQVFTGDWSWSSDIVDAYDARFHPPLLHFSGLPEAVISRVGDVSTWPVALLGLVALAAGLRGRLYDDAAVVFPLALVLALVVVVARGQISADDIGRMLTALAVFAAAGAAVALSQHTAGALRSSLAVVAVAAVPIAAAPWLSGAVHDVRDQARQARGLAKVVAPALERAAPAGYVALPRQWQGQLALAWDRPRSTFIPGRAIGKHNEVPLCKVGALIVPSAGRLPKWVRQVVLTRDWRAGVRAHPCSG